jgi:hypothetical protein
VNSGPATTPQVSSARVSVVVDLAGELGVRAPGIAVLLLIALSFSIWDVGEVLHSIAQVCHAHAFNDLQTFERDSGVVDVVAIADSLAQEYRH